MVGRYPQFRLVYRPSQKMAFGFSIENPEQQVSNSVVFPSALSNTLTTQYNTGTSGLNVPNMTPDFVLRDRSTTSFLVIERFTSMSDGDANLSQLGWDSASGKDYAFGWGVGANFNVEVKRACAGCWTALPVTGLAAISAVWLPT